MNLNELLKSQPIVILLASLLMVFAITPIVFMLAQQRSQFELVARQEQTYIRIAEATGRTIELQVRMSKLEDDIRLLRSEMAQMRTNLDVALKSIVELQKQKSDNQKK
jgi:hypothetical protein